jgi:drug/metabolite transporter (DMT)-like permease
MRLGGLLMSTQAFFAVVESASAHRLGGEASPLSLVTARSLGGVALAIAFARRVPWRSRAIGLQTVRCTLSLSSIWAYMTAYQLLPLADVTAAYYTTPLLWLIWSWALLGEPAGRHQLLLCVCGLGAALLVVKPGFGGSGSAYLVVIAGLVLNAALLPLSRQIGQYDSAPTMLFWISLTAAMAGLCIDGWPVIPLLPALFGIALIGPAAQLCGLLATRHASLAALAPFGYIKLPIAIAFGVVLFSETPDLLGIAGMVVTLGVVIVNSRIATAPSLDQGGVTVFFLRRRKKA